MGSVPPRENWKQFGLNEPSEPMIPGCQVPRPMSLFTLLLGWYFKPRHSLFCKTGVCYKLGSTFLRCQGDMHALPVDAYSAHLVSTRRHLFNTCASLHLLEICQFCDRENSAILKPALSPAKKRGHARGIGGSRCSWLLKVSLTFA